MRLKARRGGIVYGMRLEAKSGEKLDEAEQIRRFVTGCDLVIISEANWFSCPDIVRLIRLANPTCIIALEVSSWGGWVNHSAYWPLRSKFGQLAEERDWWLRYADGKQVIPTTKPPHLGIVDLSIPEACDWYAQGIKQTVAVVNASWAKERPWYQKLWEAIRYTDSGAAPGITHVFYDESHIKIGFLLNAALIMYRDQTAPRDVVHRRGLVQLVRKVGMPGIFNGNVTPADLPQFYAGCYIQNTLSEFPNAVVQAEAFAAHQDNGLLVFEHNVGPGLNVNGADAARLLGLAAYYDGMVRVNPGGLYAEPIPELRI